MDEQIYEFESDEAFMKWLRAHDPNWDCNYSGNLRDFYSAFCAGRQESQLVVECRCQNSAYVSMVKAMKPDIYWSGGGIPRRS